jgi:hypothetical protein
MQKQLKIATTGRCCPIELGWREGQISLLWSGAHTVSVSCCPIEVGKIKDAEAVPCNTSNEGEQARKAVRPLTLESNKSQQNIQQQGGPELPTDGMLGVTEEVADFEGLLDLLEEGLDSPTAAVQIADTGRSPIQIVGQKDHDPFFSVDFDKSFNSPQSLRILGFGLGPDQCDLIIAEDLAGRLAKQFSADMVTQVILGSGDPKNAPLVQMEQALKVDVSLVENGDLAFLKPGTQGHSPSTVMMGSFLDDGEGRQETLKVQAQMQLRGSFAPAVLSPVHAVGNQSDRTGVNCVHRPFETMRQALVAPCRSKVRGNLLQMSKDLPEQLLHHVAVAMLVRMGKRIAARRHCTSDGHQLRCMVSQRITDIIEPDRMCQLGENQGHHVAPRCEGPRLLVDPMFTGEFFGYMRRDKFANLMQCAAVVFGRRYVFHQPDSLVGIQRRPPFLTRFFKSLQLHPMG